MKVWLVAFRDYEGAEVVGIYATKELAESVLSQIRTECVAYEKARDAAPKRNYLDERPAPETYEWRLGFSYWAHKSMSEFDVFEFEILTEAVIRE